MLTLWREHFSHCIKRSYCWWLKKTDSVKKTRKSQSTSSSGAMTKITLTAGHVPTATTVDWRRIATAKRGGGQNVGNGQGVACPSMKKQRISAGPKKGDDVQYPWFTCKLHLTSAKFWVFVAHLCCSFLHLPIFAQSSRFLKKNTLCFSPHRGCNTWDSPVVVDVFAQPTSSSQRMCVPARWQCEQPPDKTLDIPWSMNNSDWFQLPGIWEFMAYGTELTRIN